MAIEQEDCGYVPVGAVRASALFQASEAAAAALRADNAALAAQGERRGGCAR